MPNTYVAENEKGKALRTVKIVVNVIRYSESDGVNCTLFEVAGAMHFRSPIGTEHTGC